MYPELRDHLGCDDKARTLLSQIDGKKSGKRRFAHVRCTVQGVGSAGVERARFLIEFRDTATHPANGHRIASPFKELIRSPVDNLNACREERSRTARSNRLNRLLRPIHHFGYFGVS